MTDELTVAPDEDWTPDDYDGPGDDEPEVDGHDEGDADQTPEVDDGA